ncbi:MAG: pyroglutamyl-peptidase I [Clostridia bacterium]|nr:pyroglutamyl-peptidase I [Clostridia bacterium]
MKEKKLLITGFDPFGGECINPSFEAVRLLPDKIGAFTLTKAEIPTVYEKAAQLVLEKANEILPDAIICVGQAGGRDAITPEVVGINLREASLPDNAGVTYAGVMIEENAPAAYFSTLPVREMVSAVKNAGFPCRLSYSAGAFVCNDTLFSLLHHYRDSDIPVGFIHVPFLPEQAKNSAPSLPLQSIVEALQTAIIALDNSIK